MMLYLQFFLCDFGVVKVFGFDVVRNFFLVLDCVYQCVVIGGKEVGKMNDECKMVECMFNLMVGFNGVVILSVFMLVVGGFCNFMISVMFGISVLIVISDQVIMCVNVQVLGFDCNGMWFFVNMLRNLFNGDVKCVNVEFGLFVDLYVVVVLKMGGFDLFCGIIGWFVEKILKWLGLIVMDWVNKVLFGLLMYKNIGELICKFKILDEVKGLDKIILVNKGWSNEDWVIMVVVELWLMIIVGYMGMMLDVIYVVLDEVIINIMVDRIVQVCVGSDMVLVVFGDMLFECLKWMKEVFDVEVEQMIMCMVCNVWVEVVQKLLGIIYGEMISVVIMVIGFDIYVCDDVGQLFKSFMFFKIMLFVGFCQLVNCFKDFDMVLVIKFLVFYIVGMMLVGMFVNQMNSLLIGNDLLDMIKLIIWVQVLLKGGLFGIYGDFLFQDYM